MNVFMHYFGRFLESRRSGNFFGRRIFTDLVANDKRADQPSDSLNHRLVDQAQCDLDDLLAQLETSTDGLSDTEADLLQSRYGPNEVEHEGPVRWWRHLWLSYNNPFNLLLTVLATVSYFTHDTQAAVVIGSMVVLATLIRFFQERRSNRAALALKEQVSNTAAVRRRSDRDTVAPDSEADQRRAAQPIEIPMKQIVPGDIVVLSAGDMIPADCRVIKATDLFIGQSAMTGESLPVEKFAAAGSESSSALEMANLVFMGTNVISGAATAVVLSTGNDTYFGTLATRVTQTSRATGATGATGATDTNAFQVGVNKVSWLLIRFALVMVPLVLFINGYTKGDWPEAFLFALSVAVGLTPEMLPMIVTSTLARGAVVLSRKQVIVKRLDAIQSFGAMNLLCTDKTSTMVRHIRSTRVPRSDCTKSPGS